MRVLIVYESDHGQAEKVARRLAEVIRAGGHYIDVARACDHPSLEPYAAVIAGGSIHMGKHQKALVGWCRANRDELVKRRNAFYSVSVSARRRFGAGQREVAKALSGFIAETGWTPERLWPIAGALKYTQYPFYIIGVLLLIALMSGGDTDISRDHEYTDWPALEALGNDFARSLHEEKREAA